MPGPDLASTARARTERERRVRALVADTIATCAIGLHVSIDGERLRLHQDPTCTAGAAELAVAAGNELLLERTWRPCPACHHPVISDLAALSRALHILVHVGQAPQLFPHEHDIDSVSFGIFSARIHCAELLERPDPHAVGLHQVAQEVTTALDGHRWYPHAPQVVLAPMDSVADLGRDLALQLLLTVDPRGPLSSALATISAELAALLPAEMGARCVHLPRPLTPQQQALLGATYRQGQPVRDAVEAVLAATR